MVTDIKDVCFYSAKSKLSRPLADSTHEISEISFIISEIELESGITGQGLLPHFYKDYDVSLLCTISNGYGVGSFDWIDGIIDNPLKIKEGKVFPEFSFENEYLNRLV